MIRARISASLVAFAGLCGAALADDPAALYAGHCAACHGAGRLGGTGPALIPETLGRMRGPDLGTVIAEGRPATQMPAFGGTLAPAEIAALADWIARPLAEIPRWDMAEIAANRQMNPAYEAPEAPRWTADPMNITLVVETGDHHV
ncbi:c-type cytochrome, partial [Albidovulum sp.]